MSLKPTPFPFRRSPWRRSGPVHSFGRSNRPFQPTDWIYGKKKAFLTKGLRIQTSNVLTRISAKMHSSKVARINLLASKWRPKGLPGKQFNLLQPALRKTFGGLGAFAGLGRGWKKFLRSRGKR